MIHVYTGLPGSGKTLKLAKIALKLLKRNSWYYNKTGIVRQIYSNVRFNEKIEKKYSRFIRYWTELDDLWKARDIDVIWQEMAAYLDSNDYKIVPRELKRWLQLHRHYGVDIYGDTQDFPMIDISVRRIANHVYRLFKLFGSRDKSATRPKVRFIWGVVLMLYVDPNTFADDKQDYRYVGWKLMCFGNKICNVFNSYEDLNYNSYPPLKHVIRKCLFPGCNKVHLEHK